MIPIAHHPIPVVKRGIISSLFTRSSNKNAASGASDIASASNLPWAVSAISFWWNSVRARMVWVIRWITSARLPPDWVVNFIETIRS